MNTANKITLFRILLIPVFVGLALQYAETVQNGTPMEAYRWSAIGVFLLACLSDGLDGFIARRFGQQTRLGAILDPIADKGLILSAFLTLTVSPWPIRFPLWFTTLVIGREVILIVGALTLNHIAGHVRVAPHWTGKVSTLLQLSTLAWVMLFLPGEAALATLIFVAACFTFVAGVVYILDGIAQLQASTHGESTSNL